MSLRDTRIAGGGSVGNQVSLGGATDITGKSAGSVVVNGVKVPGTVLTPTEENLKSSAACSAFLINDGAGKDLAGVFIQINGDYAAFTSAVEGTPPLYEGLDFLPLGSSTVVYPQPDVDITNVWCLAVGEANATNIACNAGSISAAQALANHLQFNFTGQSCKAAILTLSQGYGANIDTTATQTYGYSGKQKAILTISGRG